MAIKSRYLPIMFLLLISTQAYPMSRDYVVLLHGLARTSGSMEALEEALSSECCQVLNIDYSSRKFNISEIAGAVREEIISKTQGAEKIHFVSNPDVTISG